MVGAVVGVRVAFAVQADEVHHMFDVLELFCVDYDPPLVLFLHVRDQPLNYTLHRNNKCDYSAILSQLMTCKRALISPTQSRIRSPFIFD